MFTYFPNAEAIIAVAAFCALFLMGVGVWQFARGAAQRRKLIHKIKHGARLRPAATGDVLPKDAETSKILSFFGILGRKVATPVAQDHSSMRLRFLRAGFRHPRAGEIYWGAKCLFALLLPGLFVTTRLALFHLTHSAVTLTLALLGALAGFYLPDLWLRIKADRRKEKLLVALPDALDLMVVCVEAGMGLDGAFSRVAEEIHLNSPELSDELKLMNLELRAGRSREEALRDLAARSNLEEMTSLVTLLIQTDKFGTSLAASLRVFSDAYRTQRYQRAETAAAKIPVKLIFPLILFIFPALFTVILGPAAIRIWQNIISR